MKNRCFISALLLVSLPSLAAQTHHSRGTMSSESLNVKSSTAKVQSLLSVMQEALQNNPRIREGRYVQQATAEDIRLQKSKYFPEINLAAVASTGDPGSFSMLDVDGDISSTQRVGFGGALILKQDVWDFGRTSHAVETAEIQGQVQKKQESLTNAEVSREILKTYLDCAFLKTQLQNSQFIVEEAKLLDIEINRFVKSGQRSIIEKYLVDTEEKMAETRVGEFTERLHATEERLGILLAKTDGEAVSCQDLSHVQEEVTSMGTSDQRSPLIDVQEARAKLAESRLAEAEAENRPKIFGMAIAGAFDNDHLKDKNHYAAGVGISWPLFSGFLVDSQIGKKESELLAQKSSVEAIRQFVATTNSSYDEKIRSLRVRLQFLENEKSHAKKVFELAHKRYEDMQGSMTDLRESIKNVNRLVLEADETQRDILLAQGEKNLFNGYDVNAKQ